MSAEHHRHRAGDNPDAEAVQDLRDEILGGVGGTAPGRPTDLGDAERHDAEQPGAEAGAAESEPTPALVAAGLTLTTGQGPVFAGVDLTVAAGELVVLVGPAGSGRSSLLLALTGRMSGVTGDLTVDGHRLPGSAATGRRVRSLTSVARIGTVVVPEPALTVAASVTERAMIDGVGAAAGRERFAEAMRTLGADADAVRDTTIEELTALDRSVVTVALACLAPATVIVLDDLDRDLSRADVADLSGRLGRLAATGPAVVTTALDAPDLPGVTVVELVGSHPEGTAS